MAHLHNLGPVAVGGEHTELPIHLCGLEMACRLGDDGNCGTSQLVA